VLATRKEDAAATFACTYILRVGVEPVRNVFAGVAYERLDEWTYAHVTRKASASWTAWSDCSRTRVLLDQWRQVQHAVVHGDPAVLQRKKSEEKTATSVSVVLTVATLWAATSRGVKNRGRPCGACLASESPALVSVMVPGAYSLVGPGS